MFSDYFNVQDLMEHLLGGRTSNNESPTYSFMFLLI
jgi:hypothetical protein